MRNTNVVSVFCTVFCTAVCSIFIGSIFIFSLTAVALASPPATPPTTLKNSKRAYDKPLDLTVVDQDVVCGVTRDQERKTVCIGASYWGSNIEPVGQVSELFGSKNVTCARDETGLHCWGINGGFAKPIAELVGQAKADNIRITGNRLCIAQADHTVVCHSTEQFQWSAAVSRYVKFFPAPESFGPFNALKDFAIMDREICVIDGDVASCSFFKEIPLSDRSLASQPPKRKLQNPRELSVDYGIFCVADDLGVVCSKGLDLASMAEVELGAKWVGATKLTSDYDSLCAQSATLQPMCVKFQPSSSVPTESLPNGVKLMLSNPKISVLKSGFYGDSLCLKTKTAGVPGSQMACWTYGNKEVLPPGLGEIKDFFVSNKICAIAESGWISCFGSGLYAPSPLPKSPDAANYFKNCSWNSLRFFCSGDFFDSTISEVRKVIAFNNSASRYDVCFLAEDSVGTIDVRCTGTEMQELLRNQPRLSSVPTGFSLTSTQGCLYNANEHQCWGEMQSSEPIPRLGPLRKLQLGALFGCALDKFGFLCWGDLENFELTVPAAYADPEKVTDFAVGQQHICVITSDSVVDCWGANDFGQTSVPPLDHPDQIKATDFATCATDRQGVWCWGLGQSDPDNSGNKPTAEETER